MGVVLAAARTSDAAFYAVFAVFVAALVVLAVVTLRWAVRRDRAGRAEWLRRRTVAEHDGAAHAGAEGNGRAPRHSSTGRGGSAPSSPRARRRRADDGGPDRGREG